MSCCLKSPLDHGTSEISSKDLQALPIEMNQGGCPPCLDKRNQRYGLDFSFDRKWKTAVIVMAIIMIMA